MVVNDLHVIGIAIFPAKADAPLIIDANTVLPGAIPVKLLQPIAGWGPEINEGLGRINDRQLAQHGTLKLAGKSSDRLTTEQRFRVPIAEALDHAESYPRAIVTSSVTRCMGGQLTPKFSCKGIKQKNARSAFHQ